METGWRHGSHEGQREFERLQPKKAAAQGTQAEVAGAKPQSGPSRPGITPEVVVTSPQRTIDVVKNTRPAKVTYEIERHLSVYHEDVPVYTHYSGDQHSDVRVIDFRAGTNVAIQTWRHADGHIAVEISSTASGGGSYSWYLDDAFSASTEITNGETVTFTGTGIASVVRTANTINVDVPAHIWYVDHNTTGFPATVAYGETVNFIEGVGINITRSGRDITIAAEPWCGFTIATDANSDLVQCGDTVRYIPTGTLDIQLSTSVSGSTLAFYNFLSVDVAEPSAYNDVSFIEYPNVLVAEGYTEIFFTVDHDPIWIPLYGHPAGGINKTKAIVRGWAAPGAGSYDWDIQADANPAHTVASGTTVQLVSGSNIVLSQLGGVITISTTAFPDYNWIASDGSTTTNVTDGTTVTWVGAGPLTIVNSGGTFTVTRPFTIQDDGVAVGGNDTAILNFDSNGQATTAVAVNFVVTDDGGGKRSVKAYVPAGGGAYDWRASDGGAPDTIASGETVTWTGGTGIGVSYNAGTNTFTITNTAPHVSYGFNVAAEDTAGSGAVVNGATVTFTHGRGLLITRVGDDIHFELDGDGPGGGGPAKRIKTGILDFDNTVNDYITGGAKPAYAYGVRQYVDIVHGWGLADLDRFHLELVDYNLNGDGVTIDQYRDGMAPVNGDPACQVARVKFRNKPHWTAVDRNTIRVWATMSLGRPTFMKFRYNLQEL